MYRGFMSGEDYLILVNRRHLRRNGECEDAVNQDVRWKTSTGSKSITEHQLTSSATSIGPTNWSCLISLVSDINQQLKYDLGGAD
jgi:hypothetical protein